MSSAIEVKNLQYEYHDGTKALRGISFNIAEGECVGVIGPNGAGKSTLLLHLNGILPAASKVDQSVKVMGQEITNESRGIIHQMVGLLFQNPDDQLFCPTVFEDVAFGPQQFGKSPEDINQIVFDALEHVGLAGYEHRSPHHLSGGEKQRVCLAGVLACKPKVLVLDEPTKDLDPRGKRELKSLLQSIPSTKIIASHDLELIVELCPRTIVLDKGELIADGFTVDLLRNGELMLTHGLEIPHCLRHLHPHN
ncbi:MAG: ABC transporter ATP-binding protein [Bacteroidota bacterium]|nr:ABC transporter ATP-binding protein [Bacteroidota bacterium]